jgi:threonine dehydrogenase-like Zn-dependent dehydrogenase
MKAIQIVAPGQLKLRDTRSRPLRPLEVRIAVAATSICGSDLRYINNPPAEPQVPGHEFAGSIVEVSEQARDVFRVGNRVTAFPMIPCMDCLHCQDGRFRDCGDKRSLGFHLPGSFAEELVMDSRMVIPLADELTYEQGALVEHLCCGYRLARELVDRQLSSDSHILIIGDGPIALADLQAIKLAGYRHITLVGKHKRRTDLARRLGASRLIQTSEINPVMVDRQLSVVDACIFAAHAEETLNLSLRMLRPGGLVFPQTRITNPSVVDVLKEREAVIGKAFAYEISDFAIVMDLIRRKQLDTESVVSDRIDLLELADQWTSINDKGHRLKTVIINRRLDTIIEQYKMEDPS